MSTEQPSALRRNRHLLIALALIAAMAIGFFYVTRLDLRLPEAPLANVPRSASAVLYVRPDALMRSSWIHPMLERRGVFEAIGRIRRRCGFDPLAQVEDVILFAHGSNPRTLEHVGVVTRGPFQHEKLGRCLEQAFEADSLGRMRRTEIEGLPAVAPERGETRAVFLGRRGIGIGNLDLVKRIVHTVRDHQGSLGDDAVLSRIWSSVAPGREVVLVGHLPPTWRESLSEQFGAERVVPLAGMLEGLKSAGIGARVSTGLGLGARLVFDSSQHASELAGKVREKLDALKDNLFLSITPIGGLVRRVQLEATGTDVVITLDVPQEVLDRILQFGDRLAAQREQHDGAGAPEVPPSPAADEVIRPDPAGP